MVGFGYSAGYGGRAAQLTCPACDMDLFSAGRYWRSCAGGRDVFRSGRTPQVFRIQWAVRCVAGWEIPEQLGRCKVKGGFAGKFGLVLLQFCSVQRLFYFLHLQVPALGSVQIGV